MRELEATFAPSRVVAEPDAQRGAHAIVGQVPLGPPFVQAETWVDAHLPELLPPVAARPCGLRHPSRSHRPRPRAARDSSPRRNSRRSHFTVSGFKMRSLTRTASVLHREQFLC